MERNASATCRVSSSSTAKPASRKPACSHCDKGPASRPMRAIWTSSCEKNAVNAPGSLATLASRTTAPSLSSTQTLDVSNETSMPA